MYLLILKQSYHKDKGAMYWVKWHKAKGGTYWVKLGLVGLWGGLCE